MRFYYLTPPMLRNLEYFTIIIAIRSQRSSFDVKILTVPPEWMKAGRSCSGVFRDGATASRSDRKFFDNICTVFVCFVSRLNRKIRVPRLLVTVRVFCLLNCVKMYPDFSRRERHNFFLGQFSKPYPLDAYGALPLLTEILNTPLGKPDALSDVHNYYRTCTVLNCIFN